jgi:hypothetical protein
VHRALPAFQAAIEAALIDAALSPTTVGPA